MSLLANAEPSTFWAHHSWSAFAGFPNHEQTIVVLPLHGFMQLENLPFDIEEVITSVALRSAICAIKKNLPVLVMPPLRFVLGAKKSALFRVDPELAHRLLREIAQSVQAAGFSKLVFINSSHANVDLIDAASRDIRAEMNLQTFVINSAGIGLPFSDGAECADILRAIEVKKNAAFEKTHAALLDASTRLATLLVEIHERPPLNRQQSDLRAPEIYTVTVENGTVHPHLYRAFYLPALSGHQLSAWPEKENTLVIVPTGAIEQHGHHLPVGVDAILGQAALMAALPLLPAATKVLVAPAITYGKSNEHGGFPGTIFISAESLRRLLLTMAEELRALGFRRIGLYNTHGGNSAVIRYTLREIEEALGLKAFMLQPDYRPPISDQELQYGFHAGEWETSLMLAATPDLVSMDRATSEFPARIEDPGFLRPENAPAIFSWITKDLSASGVMGDATLATVEKGRVWSAAMAASLAETIVKASSAT